MNLIKGVHDTLIKEFLSDMPEAIEEECESVRVHKRLITVWRYSIPTISPETREYSGHYIICYIWDEDPEL